MFGKKLFGTSRVVTQRRDQHILPKLEVGDVLNVEILDETGIRTSKWAIGREIGLQEAQEKIDPESRRLYVLRFREAGQIRNVVTTKSNWKSARDVTLDLDRRADAATRSVLDELIEPPIASEPPQNTSTNKIEVSPKEPDEVEEAEEDLDEDLDESTESTGSDDYLYICRTYSEDEIESPLPTESSAFAYISLSRSSSAETPEEWLRDRRSIVALLRHCNESGFSVTLTDKSLTSPRLAPLMIREEVYKRLGWKRVPAEASDDTASYMPPADWAEDEQID